MKEFLKENGVKVENLVGYDPKELKEKQLDKFIDENSERIYELYCEINPEYITSDFSIEDIPYLEEFVEEQFGDEIYG